MTRNAEDAALMLSVMAGFDQRDSTSAQRDDSWLAALAVNGIPELDRPLTIGLPDEYFRTSDHMDALKPPKRAAKARPHLKSVSLYRSGHPCPTCWLPLRHRPTFLDTTACASAIAAKTLNPCKIFTKGPRRGFWAGG